VSLGDEKIKLTREQAERFATNWLKSKLDEIQDIVDEIKSRLI